MRYSFRLINLPKYWLKRSELVASTAVPDSLFFEYLEIVGMYDLF